MYKLALILKYLRRKLGPMFAAIAVMLCTAMVIIVISVMGGFLDMLQGSAKQLTGDVIITSRSLTGFAHYEKLLEQLDELPQVDSASPIITAFGMVNLGGQTVGVNVVGIEPKGYARIVRYEDTLQWSTQDMFARYGVDGGQVDVTPAGFDLKTLAMSLDNRAEGQPAMVIGIEVNPWHYRDEAGQYDFGNSAVQQQATLTVLPLTERGAPAELGPAYAKAVVVNEFKSGLYEIDKSQVFIRFDVLQKMLGMDRKENKAFDPETGEEVPGTSVRPARVSEIAIHGAEGYSLGEIDAAVQARVDAFANSHQDVTPPVVRTWEQRHAQFINAVKNEKGMVTFLFVIISVVAVFMVATTFYMTVLEKTRDIGVLRAVGASQPGIIGMFLGYGLAVGTVGAAGGLLLAIVVVVRLNEVQYWLANYLGVTSHFAWCAVGLGLIGTLIGGVVGFIRRKFVKLAVVFALVSALCGLAIAWGILIAFPELGPRLNEMIRFKMWDPQTYFFDRIPARIAYVESGAIVIGAIVASVIGALIPAIIAAELDPVESLRHE
jgi:lipoprotein-releasing system permease protein